LNVGYLLTQNGVRFPEKTAIVVEDRKVTYRQLNLMVNELANGLLKFGIRKGTKAAILLQNCLEWVEIYYALSKIGAVLVPINYRLVEDDLLYIINHSDSEIVFLGDAHTKAFERGRHYLKHVKHFVSLSDNPPHWCMSYSLLKQGVSPIEPEHSAGGADEHTISYTSGTTGLPKGAVLTHHTIITGHLMGTALEFGVSEDDVILVTTPLCQRIGWGKIAVGIPLGCTMVIMTSFDAKKAMELVQKERVTIIGIIPTIGRMLLQVPHLESYDASSLRMFFVTGETFPIETKRSLKENFPHVNLASYLAQTEAGFITKLHPRDIFRKPDSVGVPLIGLEMKIVNDQQEELPAGESGEIVVRYGSPGTFGVMKGYYKDPEANQGFFLGDDWVRTGDIGKMDDDGYLYFVDRKKDMIISGGFNIYSKEVEKALEGHPKVLEAAVVAIPDKLYGEAVKAFVVLHEGQKATKGELIEYCKTKMASYKKPKEIEFIDSLPRNTVGKVMKYVLKGTG